MGDDNQEEAQRKLQKPPQLTNDQVQRAIKMRFGVEIEPNQIVELDSYDDRNYLVREREKEPETACWDGASYVLKVHNGVDSHKPSFIQAQIAAFARLRQAGIRCPLDVFPNIDPKNRESATLLSEYYIRLLYYVPGEMLYDRLVRTKSEFERHNILYGVGKTLAQANEALQGFELEHPAAVRSHVWDLQCFLNVREFAQVIKDEEKQNLIKEIFDVFASKQDFYLKNLRRSVIQGDANDRNIVICKDDVPALLDLGDMVHSYTVGELAIAVAYCIVGYFTNNQQVVEDASDTCLVRCAKMVQGYHSQFRLTDFELDSIYDLARARLATSASIGAYSAAKDPSNPYLLLHSVPAWNSIRALKLVGKERFDQLVINLPPT